MNKHAAIQFIIINTNNEILVEHKISDEDANQLVIPGGHVEGSETPLQALNRELLEELQITTNNAVEICTLPFTSKSGKEYVIYYYYIADYNGNANFSDIERPRWIPFKNAERLLPYDIDKKALRAFRKKVPK